MPPAVRVLLAALLVAAPPAARGADKPSAAAAPFAAAPSVSDRDLGAIAGRTDVSMVVNARNTATVANNSVSGDSTTGTISFDASSFSAMNGLSVLSANTGNNVAINSSLNVNVAIRP